ncbi:MAG: recombination protein RecR [Deltaproteobacteria bacterium]|nr:recombination protein RecR [Deltaproteobacteria bacterium]
MTDPIRTLVQQLSRLPGIGERTATRLVHHLLRQDRELMRALAHSLVDVAERVHECPRCCLLCATEDSCAVCSDPRRDDTLLCVVATIQDQAAIEATGEMRGRYHVLHGTLSPLDGIGPEELRIQPLLARLSSADRAVTEVILATPPSVDGEATALYLSRQLAPLGLKVSRIASGVPVGGDLQLADRLTLSRALSLRRVL